MASLVLCFDGTGNEFRSASNTNVVRIHHAVSPAGEVLKFYDPGVGTVPGHQSWSGIGMRWRRLLGLAFGFGIKDNIKEGYRFLMEYWQPGHSVYLFGFSRGAYTARALAGMLQTVGLLPPHGENLVDYALQIYWKRKPDFALAGRFKSGFSRPEQVEISYLGIFDTVKSVGLWDALLQGFARALRRIPPFSSLRLALPYTRSLPNVAAGRHAVSIDEKRTRFRPNLWRLDPPRNGPEFQQAWFAGVHSDVGGGYPDDERELADITLEWVMRGAEYAGLMFESSRIPRVSGDSSLGRVHNSLIPIWWILGWRRRRIPEWATIHPSVIDRMNRLEGYRPRLPNQLSQ
ncbi:MAG: DUF2235 domain-containing protein [Acidimicrobiia bacterium]|nr:DUF2235 domain-containing protein [Acidimicrobiia bacterium]